MRETTNDRCSIQKRGFDLFPQKSNCSGFFWMASVIQYGAWRFVVISCAKMLKSRS